MVHGYGCDIRQIKNKKKDTQTLELLDIVSSKSNFVKSKNTNPFYCFLLQ